MGGREIGLTPNCGTYTVVLGLLLCKLNGALLGPSPATNGIPFWTSVPRFTQRFLPLSQSFFSAVHRNANWDGLGGELVPVWYRMVQGTRWCWWDSKGGHTPPTGPWEHTLSRSPLAFAAIHKKPPPPGPPQPISRKVEPSLLALPPVSLLCPLKSLCLVVSDWYSPKRL